MLEALIKRLEEHRSWNTSGEIERFDATLNQIAMLNDPRTIGLLIPFLDDKCRFPPAMFSIIHTIESFDDETYVREVLRALPEMWGRSPYWCHVLHFRILNHPTSRLEYRNQITSAEPAIKSAANALLTTMRDNEPKFAQACDEMLALLRP